MRTLPRWFHLLVLLTVALVISACGGGGSSDPAPTFNVEGQVLNGALVGSTVEVFGANGAGVLGTATTDADGRYTAEVSQDGPYRLRASGGKLGGVYYTGTLESTCPAGSGCFLTPYTSTLLRLVDDHGFNYGDAKALVAGSLGFDGDPFAEEVPAEDFDLGAAREAIAGGTGLEAWVDSIVGWASGEDVELPPGIVDPDPVVPLTHAVSANAGDGGSVSPTDQEVDHGTTAEFTVTPDTGYSIDSVSGCDGSLDGNTYTTGPIIETCTVNATFALVRYTLTYAAGPNGSLEGDTPQSVSHGASGTSVTAVPDTGYSFTQWSDASTDNPRTDSNVTGDLSVSASFALNRYTVSATAGDGGSITPTSQEVDHGTTAQFEVTPETGYSIGTVSGCDGSLNGNTYTTGVITEACTVEASFLLNAYTVFATAGPGGDITPTSQEVDHDTTAEFTVTPETGYTIDQVVGCDGTLTGSTYTTGAITEPCTVTATFVVTLQPPTNVTAEPGDGAVTISWDAAPDAQSYNVYWSTTSGIHPYTAASYDGFQASVTSPHVVNGLQNGEDYFFIVTAAAGQAESLASEEVSAQPRYRFVIVHPYSDIDWQRYAQHKANLHTHTQMSDGDSMPDVVIDRYRSLGYTILSLTDHDTMGPESPTWPWTDYGRNPQSLGMIAIQGNEISRPHHIGSYYNDYGDASETSADRAIAEIGRRNGLAVLFHPGRYNYPVSWYVDLYRKHGHLIGLEVYNQIDRYPGDRATWDAILTVIAHKRPVWAFANDDMHRINRHLGYSWNVMLVPELTDAHVREAMGYGRFFFVHSPHGHDGPPPPAVSSVVADEAKGMISVAATGHERVDWISEGTIIHTGESLDLRNFPSVDRYIRAVIHAEGSDAIVGTQPFRLLPR